MIRFVIIGIALLSEYKVSCEFKCRTEGCVGQKELNGQFASYFKGQEHAPCLKFSRNYVSVLLEKQNSIL